MRSRPVLAAPPGLFDQHCHRISLVHQAQLAALMAALFVHRVHENATAGQHAMHIGHHRRHPAHVEVDPARPGLALLQLFDIALHGLLPETGVGCVDRKFARLFGDRHEGLGIDEAAHLAIEGEGMHAMTDGEHEHGRGAEQRIAGRDLLAPRLHEALLGSTLFARRHAQHREDHAHRNIDIDVR